MKEWLKNSWYAVAQVSELTAPEMKGKALKKTVMRQNLALFIDGDGKYAAVNDVCPHMGASLSLGCVRDGQLVCPYHQFTFGSDGHCKSVPSIINGGKIPANALIDSYPVVEKYGLIWVFLGDTLEAQRIPIVTVPEFEMPEFHRLYHEVVWRGSVRPMLENLIDFTHFSYLHAQTFGHGDFPFRDNYKVNKNKYEVSCTVKVKINPKGWFFPPMPEAGENPDVTVFCRFHLPTVVVNDFSIGKYKDVTLFTFTPRDENETLIRMYGCRNYDKEPTTDESLKNLGERILKEDQGVIESCMPEVLPQLVGIPVDRYLLAARGLYDQFLKAGNSVEPHVRPTNRGFSLTVLPSPVRRENPSFGRAWGRKEAEGQKKKS
ncbi:MAG: aromatic ring-hydroxylating dioxygenase subunit alpha [Candidatus Obscuribacterales bacterium]|nr:aromatic ring-hydroxylating dioxygenase subunit alpha [Candidatus Obscuribacterales bacterium]